MEMRSRPPHGCACDRSARSRATTARAKAARFQGQVGAGQPLAPCQYAPSGWWCYASPLILLGPKTVSGAFDEYILERWLAHRSAQYLAGECLRNFGGEAMAIVVVQAQVASHEDC